MRLRRAYNFLVVDGDIHETRALYPGSRRYPKNEQSIYENNRTSGASLRPSAEQSHDTSTCEHLEHADNDLPQWSVAHLFVKDELVCQKLNGTSVEQDTCRDGVKGTCDVGGGG